MFGLEKLFGNKPSDLTLAKDKIAEILSMNPEALDAFEKAYNKASIDAEESCEYLNAKTMAQTKAGNIPSNCFDIVSITERIAKELIDGTKVYRYAKNKQNATYLTLKETLPSTCVKPSDLAEIPQEYKPELTGNYMKVDIGMPTYQTLISQIYEMKNTSDPRKAKQLYNMFRQGLDILDLDPVTYEMLGMNKNAMGYWLPAMIPAVEKEGFFSIPNTTIAKVPLPMLQLTRLDYMSHTRTTLDIVDMWAQTVFELDPENKYFIKTGTYSSKFDFRNAKVTDPKEIMEIGEYLLFIHSQAISMAQHDLSGSGRPCMYGVSTTNEWVVREFIEDEDDEKFTIYHGLPLHTEYRLFVDFDSDEVLGIHPYWDPEVMKKRFGHAEDSNDPDMIHDYITYSAQEKKLMERYEQNKDAVIEHVKAFLPDVNLTGQWSIDIMQNGNKFWFIDMALAENSAFYNETVPTNKRIPSEENWIPKLKVQ